MTTIEVGSISEAEKNDGNVYWCRSKLKHSGISLREGTKKYVLILLRFT